MTAPIFTEVLTWTNRKTGEWVKVRRDYWPGNSICTERELSRGVGHCPTEDAEYQRAQALQRAAARPAAPQPDRASENFFAPAGEGTAP